jgi:hypothetical protein
VISHGQKFYSLLPHKMKKKKALLLSAVSLPERLAHDPPALFYRVELGERHGIVMTSYRAREGEKLAWTKILLWILRCAWWRGNFAKPPGPGEQMVR